MDRNEAIERIKRHMIVHQIGAYPHIKLAEALSMAIEALQEPEIVRCKDCVYAYEVDCREPKYDCRNISRTGCTQWVASDDFCSYGER